MDDEDEISYYTLLSVDKSASRDEINKAYKVYSRTFHPDRNGTSDPEAKRIADDLSRRANEARDVLMDPAKRRLYDLYGAKGLKQLTTVSKGGESFRAALEDLQEHRANRVAEPEGRVTVGLNMQDAIRALKDGRTFYPPEMSMLSVLHGFQHPISKTEAIFLYGFVGDSVSWGPTKKHEDGLYYSDKRVPRRGVGIRYVSKATEDDGFSASLQTSGEGITATATREQRLDKMTTSEVSVEADSEHGFSGEVSIRRDLAEPDENKTNWSSFGRAHISSSLEVSGGVEAVSTKHVTLRAEVKLAGIATDESSKSVTFSQGPEVRLSWKRRAGPSLYISAGGESSVSVGYSIFRSLDRHTHLRFGAGLHLGGGISWNVDYHRSKQHISLPMRITDEVPSIPWLLGLMAAPYIADFIFRKILWAPIRNRKQLEQKRELLNGLRRARLEQRFQKNEAEDMRRVEIEANGIVILQARYGINTDAPQNEQHSEELFVPSWIDVSVVLQTRVHHEREHSRLVLAEDFALIPGFFDCAPDADNKVLSVVYLYRGELHVAEYDVGEPVILPQAEHRVQGEWKKMSFDWPVEGLETAEGVGID